MSDDLWVFSFKTEAFLASCLADVIDQALFEDVRNIPQIAEKLDEHGEESILLGDMLTIDGLITACNEGSVANRIDPTGLLHLLPALLLGENESIKRLGPESLDFSCFLDAMGGHGPDGNTKNRFLSELRFIIFSGKEEVAAMISDLESMKEAIATSDDDLDYDIKYAGEETTDLLERLRSAEADGFADVVIFTNESSW